MICLISVNIYDVDQHLLYRYGTTVASVNETRVCTHSKFWRICIKSLSTVSGLRNVVEETKSSASLITSLIQVYIDNWWKHLRQSCFTRNNECQHRQGMSVSTFNTVQEMWPRGEQSQLLLQQADLLMHAIHFPEIPPSLCMHSK